MRIFNKLVRDRIPAIIESNGGSCKYRVMDDKEYQKALDAKLTEELQEYLKSGEVEELADLEEVLRAILKAKGVDYEHFEQMRKRKAASRGGFDRKILLESTSKENEL